MPILRGSATGNLQSDRDNGLPLSTVYYSGGNGWAQHFLLRIFELLIKSVINRPRASAFPPDTLQCFETKLKPPTPVYECCKRAQLSCLVLNIFRCTDTVMESGLFYDLHMRNKNRCSLRHRRWVIGSVVLALFFPPTPPPPPHPSSLFTNVAVIYSHSIYYCCTLQEGESWPFSLASSRIVKLIYWKYQSAGGEGEPRRIYVTSVCTLPPRGRGLQLQEDRPERLDECTELWVEGIQMQRGTVCTELY